MLEEWGHNYFLKIIVVATKKKSELALCSQCVYQPSLTWQWCPHVLICTLLTMLIVFLCYYFSGRWAVENAGDIAYELSCHRSSVAVIVTNYQRAFSLQVVITIGRPVYY